MWIIATLAGLAVLIIFILSISLHLRLHIDISGRPKFKTNISWFFGLVNKEISNKEEPSLKKKTAKSGRKSKKKVFGFKTVLQILRAKGFLKQVKTLLKDVIRCIKLRILEVDFRLGLDDPADTGLLFAFIGPAVCFLNSFFPDRIKVQASFADESVLEGSLDTDLSLRPLRLSIPLLKFIFSPPVFRVTRILVFAKWKRRK